MSRPRTHLNTVLGIRAIILAEITYALLAWRGFLTVEQIGRIDSFLSEHLNIVFFLQVVHISGFG